MLVKIYYSIDDRAVQDTETAFINPEQIQTPGTQKMTG